MLLRRLEEVGLLLDGDRCGLHLRWHLHLLLLLLLLRRQLLLLVLGSSHRELNGKLLRHLHVRVLSLAEHQVHGDCEHLARKHGCQVRIGELPNARTGLFVQLCLRHDLLHLFLSQVTFLLFVKHGEHLLVALLVFGVQAPHRLLQFRSQLSHGGWAARYPSIKATLSEGADAIASLMLVLLLMWLLKLVLLLRRL